MASGSEAAARPRVSAAEREQIATRLREACVDERLSVNTFVARIESAYSVRTRPELAMLVADIPEPGWLTRVCAAAVTAGSRFTHQLRAAWRLPRTADLVLPLRSQAYLGRSHGCDYVLPDEAVSRRHALLAYTDGRWWVDDCTSKNGTFLNGWRISSATEVRPGDELTLANRRFILRAPPLP
jgi:FHA domain/Domain of unknown function (DUF1707)